MKLADTFPTNKIGELEYRVGRVFGRFWKREKEHRSETDRAWGEEQRDTCSNFSIVMSQNIDIMITG